MSIVDHNGKPVAYAWNDIAAQEKHENDRTLRLISDDEFERRFPHLLEAPKRLAPKRRSRRAVAA